MAASSYTGFPVRRDKAPNSTTKVPTPAVQVTGVSPAGTPCLRFTVPYGIPVGVSKAGSSLCTTSSARDNNGPVQGHPGDTGTPALLASRWADKRPPTIRILVSNTDTLMFASKLVLSAMRLYTLVNSE